LSNPRAFRSDKLRCVLQRFGIAFLLVQGLGPVVELCLEVLYLLELVAVRRRLVESFLDRRHLGLLLLDGSIPHIHVLPRLPRLVIQRGELCQIDFELVPLAVLVFFFRGFLLSFDRKLLCFHHEQVWGLFLYLFLLCKS
jgi:hypothetical protein